MATSNVIPAHVSNAPMDAGSPFHTMHNLFPVYFAHWPLRRIVRNFLSRLGLFALVLFTPEGRAQVAPETLRRLNSELAREATSAIEIFSAANTVSTGTFHYDNTGPDDVDFATYKIPLTHKFGAATNRLRPFVEGYFGYFKLHEDVTGLGPPVGDFDIQSLTVTAGGGLEWNATSWLSISPRVLLAYSHIWQDYDRNVPPTDPTANVIVDYQADALTILPSLGLDGQWRSGRWNFGLNSRYTYLHARQLHATSSLVDLETTAHVWRNSTSLRYHPPWKLFNLPLNFLGEFARHDLAGDIRRTDFVDHFYEVRAGLNFVLPESLRPVKEIGFTGAYYFKDRLNGYSIGLNFEF